MELFGCFALTRFTPTYAEENPEAELSVKETGEYSAVPVLSPTGNVNDDGPVNDFRTSPLPFGTIIADADGDPAMMMESVSNK